MIRHLSYVLHFPGLSIYSRFLLSLELSIGTYFSFSPTFKNSPWGEDFLYLLLSLSFPVCYFFSSFVLVRFARNLFILVLSIARFHFMINFGLFVLFSNLLFLVVKLINPLFLGFKVCILPNRINHFLMYLLPFAIMKTFNNINVKDIRGFICSRM